MSPADQVIHAFLSVNDKRPVLEFEDEDRTNAFTKLYPGAEVYHRKTHVFLPSPFGLELVWGGPNGETAFQFHYHKQAEMFMAALKGYGAMREDGGSASRTVFVGRRGRDLHAGPIFPGVA